MENMATYTSGQALFTYEKLLRPFEMRVSLVEKHGESTPNDNELYEMMLKKPAFFELQKAETQAQWEHLKEQVQKLLDIERKAIHQLINFNFIEMQYKEFESNIESFSKILDILNVMKRVYKFECVSISERFILKERKNNL